MKFNRRNFLKSSLVLSATSLTTTNPVLAESLGDDYKALVGVFLFGGNDAYNMVIPQEGVAYDDYVNARPSIAIDKDKLLNTGLQCENGVALGLHPAMSALEPMLFNDNFSIIVNSGQLVEPRVGNPAAQLPDFLMAHNLQQALWQSGTLNMSDSFGWAGKLLDLSGKRTSLSPAISIFGEQKWLRHATQSPLIVPQSRVGSYGGGVDRLELMLSHSDLTYQNIYKQHYASSIREKYTENIMLADVLNKNDVTSNTVIYPNTSLGKQLQLTAKMIKSRRDMGHEKQIFMVGIGGFDTHHDQLPKHASLLTQVAEALAAFQEDLEQARVEEKVTTFTMSDFGRRVMANDTGTDHGWGGHQLVMGGAVKGVKSNNGKAYGKWPDLKPGSEYDYNNGRVIPEIAADQVNATLAKWFLGSADAAQLTDIFPSLVKFKGKETIGFL